MNIGSIILYLVIRVLGTKKDSLQKSLDKAKLKASQTKSETDDYRVAVLQFMLDTVPNPNK